MFDCGRAYDSAELIHPALYGTMYLKHSSTPIATAATASTAATATASTITGAATATGTAVDAAYTTPVMAGYALVHTPQLVLQAAAATAAASKAAATAAPAATAATAASNPWAVKLKPTDQCPTCLIRKPGCPLCWDMPDG
jgi:hypothetical protein